MFPNLRAQLCPTVDAGSSTDSESLSSAPTMELVPPTISAARSASNVRVLRYKNYMNTKSRKLKALLKFENNWH